jgi:hypothetical protein
MPLEECPWVGEHQTRAPPLPALFCGLVVTAITAAWREPSRVGAGFPCFMASSMAFDHPEAPGSRKRGRLNPGL